MNKKVEINFEKALEELESIVEDLESGDLSLENSLKSFEKGIKLARQCQEKLSKAELQVQKLIEEDGELKTTPLKDVWIWKPSRILSKKNQSKIRRAGAKNLTQSWQSIPHVSHFEEADITKIEKQRKDLNEISAIKITPLAYIIKATSFALEEFPFMNSSLVDDGKLMVKKYINIGVAVNTDQGLVVPVIKDVNNMKIGKIAEAILEISIKARDKKLMKDDIAGSTFTISSLGGIGGTGFSPIINPPEVGIIGVSRARKVAEIENGSLVDTAIMPFSLSYDHRVINGVDAGNFMTFIKSTIEKGL